LTLITRQSPWSRNLWQILRSRNSVLLGHGGCDRLFGRRALRAFLAQRFRFGLLSLHELGLAIAAGFGTLILLVGIKRFSVQFQKRQGASSVRP
jgi:hypothetical protein